MGKLKVARDFWYGLTFKQRFLFRRLYNLPLDLFDRISGRTHKYVPPRGLIYTGSSAGAKSYYSI